MPSPSITGRWPNAARTGAGRRVSRGAGRVKMSARAMISPLRSIQIGALPPLCEGIPKGFSALCESRTAILSVSSKNAAHLPGTVHPRPSHSSSAGVARLHPRRTGRARRRRGQPAEPDRERQARAEALAAAVDRDGDRRRGDRPALVGAAEPAGGPRDRTRARAVELGLPAARHPGCEGHQGHPRRDDRIDPGPAPRTPAPRARGDRDTRGGAAREHRAAPADARPRQLPRRDRAARREAAQGRGPRVRRPHPPHRERHGRAARIRAALRQRPAPLRAVGHRPRERPHLPAPRVHPGRPRAAIDGAAGDGPSAARAPAAHRLRRLPRAAPRDQLLRRVRASCPRAPRSPSSRRRRRTATSPSRTSATRSASRTRRRRCA